MSTDESDKDEPKTERFNMFMSPSEMKAIDDWAWESRIRSKSEAVRRLVQMGLEADSVLEGMLESIIELLTDQSEILMDLDAGNTPRSFRGMLLDQDRILTAVIGLAISIGILKGEGPTNEVIDRAAELSKSVRRTAERLAAEKLTIQLKDTEE